MFGAYLVGLLPLPVERELQRETTGAGLDAETLEVPEGIPPQPVANLLSSAVQQSVQAVMPTSPLLPVSPSTARTRSTSVPTVAFSVTRTVKLAGGYTNSGAWSLKSYTGYQKWTAVFDMFADLT